MSEFHSQWLEAQSETPERRTDKTDKTIGHCSVCGRKLYLPESQALGKCIRSGCQGEMEFVDTLARMRVRRERIAAAVDTRAQILRRGKAS